MRKLPKLFTRRFIFSVSLILNLSNFQHVYAIDEIAAVVNNEIITRKDMEDFANFMKIQLSEEYTGAELDKKIESMKPDMLNKLIEDRIILQEAAKEKIQVDQQRIKKRINEIKSRYSSESEFQADLAKQGLSQSDIETKIREQFLMYAIIEKKIKDKMVINPREVTNYYRDNQEKFRLPKLREFETLAVSDFNLAKEIINSLKGEHALAKIAAKYSLTVNKLSASRQSELRKEIGEIIFKINPGEVAGPVRIDDKYYILKLNSVSQARIQTLGEVQDEIHLFLFNKEMQEELSKWLEDLKKNSYIRFK